MSKEQKVRSFGPKPSGPELEQEINKWCAAQERDRSPFRLIGVSYTAAPDYSFKHTHYALVIYEKG